MPKYAPRRQGFPALKCGSCRTLTEERQTVSYVWVHLDRGEVGPPKETAPTDAGNTVQMSGRFPLVSSLISNFGLEPGGPFDTCMREFR
jgi:hypothetical protein